MIRRPLDARLSPKDVLARLFRAPGPFLLESALRSPSHGRWSFAGAWPTATIESWPGGPRDPLAVLDGVLAGARGGRGPEEQRARRADLGVPFAGGAVGFLGYDYGRRLERVPAIARGDQRFPDVFFRIYPHILACDHEASEWSLVGLAEGFDEARARYARILAVEEPPLEERGDPPRAPTARTFTRESYRRAVERAIAFIRAGDIFEVNLSQRFEARVVAPAPAVYARLAAEAPAPFAACIGIGRRGHGDTCERAVLSASPERFLSLRGTRLETEPIKGTRPRANAPAQDDRLRRELLESRKDRAELAMIVDLARNDLGRVAAAGSVRVREACALRSFPTVHHLLGTVEAELARGRTAFDAIRAAFPPGSITGAPKLRAMEIIDELEPTRRSVYTGAIGHVGIDGDMDLSVAIRTVLLDGERATFQAGGAVTAESDPDAEYAETLAKARAIGRACGVDPSLEVAALISEEARRAG